MVKTTVYLPERTKQRLARAAARRHRSEAELIRDAIDRLLRDEPPERRPVLGIFDSGDPDFAENVDEILAEGFGRDGVDW
jgi:Arc/MetJ-type ribon-helix-helix transcriptional regulator